MAALFDRCVFDADEARDERDAREMAERRKKLKCAAEIDYSRWAHGSRLPAGKSRTLDEFTTVDDRNCKGLSKLRAQSECLKSVIIGIREFFS